MRVKTVEVQDRADATTSRSIGDVFGDLSAELHRMVRTELDAAKHELRAAAPDSGRPAVLLGGAAAAAALAVVFGSIALAIGLAQLIPVGFAFLLVGVAYGVGAWVLYQRRQAELAPDEPVGTLEPVDGNDY